MPPWSRSTRWPMALAMASRSGTRRLAPVYWRSSSTGSPAPAAWRRRAWRSAGRGGAQAAEQASGDGMARIAEDFPDFALFDDAAAFEDHHAVADLADDRHLVGDQDDGQAQPAVDVAQQREDRLGALRVQRRGGFVAEQYLRLVHQRAGDADALFLPAGELRRIGVAFFLQADQLQQPGDPLLDPCPGHPGHPQRQGDVLPHGLGRHQVEVLEDHADASAQGDQALAVVAADVFVVDQHLLLAGTLQAIEGADQRGLSGAAAADDAEHFAAADFRSISAGPGLHRRSACPGRGDGCAAWRRACRAPSGTVRGAAGSGNGHGRHSQPGWYSVPWALSSAARTTGECW